jgi:hypothetical protein
MITVVSFTVDGTTIQGTLLDNSSGYERFAGFTLEVKSGAGDLTHEQIAELLEAQSAS